MINISHTKKQAARYRELAKNAQDLGVRATMNKMAKDYDQLIKNEIDRQTAVNWEELVGKYESTDPVPLVAPKVKNKKETA